VPVEPSNEQSLPEASAPPRPIRIYAAADIHGRPSRLARVAARIRRDRPDVLVLAGDLIHYRHPEAVIEFLRTQSLPVLVVRGNTDPVRHMAGIYRLPPVHDMNGTAAVFRGCRFVGIGGTFLLPFRSKVAFQERPVMSRMASLMTPGDVLIMHPPPYGCRDRVLKRFHSGSRSLTALIEAARPAVAICGHIHEQAGTGRIGDTTVVNCTMGGGGDGAIIDIQPGQPPHVHMV